MLCDAPGHGAEDCEQGQPRVDASAPSAPVAKRQKAEAAFCCTSGDDCIGSVDEGAWEHVFEGAGAFYDLYCDSCWFSHLSSWEGCFEGYFVKDSAARNLRAEAPGSEDAVRFATSSMLAPS